MGFEVYGIVEPWEDLGRFFHSVETPTWHFKSDRKNCDSEELEEEIARICELKPSNFMDICHKYNLSGLRLLSFAKASGTANALELVEKVLDVGYFASLDYSHKKTWKHLLPAEAISRIALSNTQAQKLLTDFVDRVLPHLKGPENPYGLNEKDFQEFCYICEIHGLKGRHLCHNYEILHEVNYVKDFSNYIFNTILAINPLSATDALYAFMYPNELREILKKGTPYLDAKPWNELFKKRASLECRAAFGHDNWCRMYTNRLKLEAEITKVCKLYFNKSDRSRFMGICKRNGLNYYHLYCFTKASETNNVRELIQKVLRLGYENSLNYQNKNTWKVISDHEAFLRIADGNKKAKNILENIFEIQQDVFKFEEKYFKKFCFRCEINGLKGKKLVYDFKKRANNIIDYLRLITR